ncbi:hypothetical protein M501DRAFT_1017435 [Patellaria atrata CBS 101060]|uniref:Uncharacterized protein n=1 Tax=Patellaria atrata CBS 101060 TaxID=1346257 RepID=A0A9P4S9B5_9PEZI|nr:hypothetical protein M501DRAFT_1017435 [Patellaria atrata CBS 101060]
MNWTGGRLQRHAKNNNSVVARQKQYFSKVRTKLQNDTSMNQGHILFKPEFLLGNDDSINVNLPIGEGTRTHVGHSKMRQSILEDYGNVAPLAKRLSSMKHRTSSPDSKDSRKKQKKFHTRERSNFSFHAEDHGSSRKKNRDEPGRHIHGHREKRKDRGELDDTHDKDSIGGGQQLELSRQRLLQQRDWVGLAPTRPLRLSFSNGKDEENIGKRRKVARNSFRMSGEPPLRRDVLRKGLPQDDDPFMSGALNLRNDTNDIRIRIGTEALNSQTSVRQSVDIVLDQQKDRRRGLESSDSMLLDAENEMFDEVQQRVIKIPPLGSEVVTPIPYKTEALYEEQQRFNRVFNLRSGEIHPIPEETEGFHEKQQPVIQVPEYKQQGAPRKREEDDCLRQLLSSTSIYGSLAEHHSRPTQRVKDGAGSKEENLRREHEKWVEPNSEALLILSEVDSDESEEDVDFQINAAQHSPAGYTEEHADGNGGQDGDSDGEYEKRVRNTPTRVEDRYNWNVHPFRLIFRSSPSVQKEEEDGKVENGAEILPQTDIDENLEDTHISKAPHDPLGDDIYWKNLLDVDVDPSTETDDNQNKADLPRNEEYQENYSNKAENGSIQQPSNHDIASVKVVVSHPAVCQQGPDDPSEYASPQSANPSARSSAPRQSPSASLQQIQALSTKPYSTLQTRALAPSRSVDDIWKAFVFPTSDSTTPSPASSPSPPRHLSSLAVGLSQKTSSAALSSSSPSTPLILTTPPHPASSAGNTGSSRPEVHRTEFPSASLPYHYPGNAPTTHALAPSLEAQVSNTSTWTSTSRSRSPTFAPQAVTDSARSAAATDGDTPAATGMSDCYHTAQPAPRKRPNSKVEGAPHRQEKGPRPVFRRPKRFDGTGREAWWDALKLRRLGEPATRRAKK